MDWWGNLPVFFETVKRSGEDAYNWLTDLVPDEYKSHPGDPGYFPADNLNPETDILPYLPGARELQELYDSSRYWQDYHKNTGFRPRYPGMQIHTPTIGQTIGAFDWWLP